MVNFTCTAKETKLNRQNPSHYSSKQLINMETIDTLVSEKGNVFSIEKIEYTYQLCVNNEPVSSFDDKDEAFDTMVGMFIRG